MTLDFVGKLYEVVAKSQLKKVIKLWQQEVRKAEEKAKRDAEAEEAEQRPADHAEDREGGLEEVSRGCEPRLGDFPVRLCLVRNKKSLQQQKPLFATTPVSPAFIVP